MLSIEGADSLIDDWHVKCPYALGLHAIGPANFGPGIYAQGTDATGGIEAKGTELLKKMDRLGTILDATHLCDDSFRESMDVFQGKVLASHSSSRTLVSHNRPFNDEQLPELICRGALIGACPNA